MKIAFQDESFAYEFVRNIGYAAYGGADIGEMVSTAGRIKEGDFDSWHAGWKQTAERLRVSAEGSLAGGHERSAFETYLRASSYYRMAEFYLHGNPDDPRILPTWKLACDCYARAAKLAGPTWEPVEIPYEGTTLPGYFYKVDNSGKPRPTLIYHGGLDSILEELYFIGGAAAVRRGYNCLTFDGPGQGGPRREQKLVFRYDWEKVVSPAVDYALTRPEVDPNRLALMGLSLGGYLGARAASFEPRFKAAVFFNGLYGFHATARGEMPKEAIGRLDQGDAKSFEDIVYKQMQTDTNLRWAVTQGTWSFGAESLTDYVVNKTKPFALEGVADKIRCPSLVLEAEKDTLVGAGQAKALFDVIQAPKQYIYFTAEEGAEEHVESGAYLLAHQRIFDWMDEVLGVRSPVHAA